MMGAIGAGRLRRAIIEMSWIPGGLDRLFDLALDYHTCIDDQGLSGDHHTLDKRYFNDLKQDHFVHRHVHTLKAVKRGRIEELKIPAHVVAVGSFLLDMHAKSTNFREEIEVIRRILDQIPRSQRWESYCHGDL